MSDEKTSFKSIRSLISNIATLLSRSAAPLMAEVDDRNLDAIPVQPISQAECRHIWDATRM